MADLLPQLMADGFSVLDLGPFDFQNLNELYHQSRRFFARDHEAKCRHSVVDGNHGYREFGQEYSLDPSRPDLDEQFIYWGADASRIPGEQELAPMMIALENYRQSLMAIVDQLLHELKVHFDYRHALDVENASNIQINGYNIESDRDLLQDRHEDGLFVTLIAASAPGLEYFVGDRAEPGPSSPQQLLVMPGSIMTDMTGGMVKPLYHHVRNHKDLSRLAVMYFVNPNVDSEVHPYVVNDYNRELDIRRRVIENPRAYGLPDTPVD